MLMAQNFNISSPVRRLGMVELDFFVNGMGGTEGASVMSYDPTIARWTTEDPDGYAGSGANLYQFLGSNPLRWTDPSGLWWGSGILSTISTTIVDATGLNGGDVAAAFWTGAGEGALDGDRAFVNGLTPFVTPFGPNDFYDPNTRGLGFSYGSGIYVQNVLVLGEAGGTNAAGIGIGREILAKTSSEEEWQLLQNMSLEDRISYLWDKYGLTSLLPSGEWSQYLKTIFEGTTPLGWLALWNVIKGTPYYLHWLLQHRPPCPTSSK
jgi:hypothetical protein